MQLITHFWQPPSDHDNSQPPSDPVNSRHATLWSWQQSSHSNGFRNLKKKTYQFSLLPPVAHWKHFCLSNCGFRDSDSVYLHCNKINNQVCMRAFTCKQHQNTNYMYSCTVSLPEPLTMVNPIKHYNYSYLLRFCSPHAPIYKHNSQSLVCVLCYSAVSGVLQLVPYLCTL